MKKCLALLVLRCILSESVLLAQHQHEIRATAENVLVEAQPLLSQAIRLNDALSFLGSSLSPGDSKAIRSLQNQPLGKQTVTRIQEILDPYCLNFITINGEARVSIENGPAAKKLVQGGWKSFLVKIRNDAGVTAKLEVQSPNSVKPFHSPSFTARVEEKDRISKGQAENRFLDVAMYRGRPMLPNLSGLKLEYAVVQIYSKDAGKREAELSYHIGQGSQDIGFRNSTHVLFDISPSVKVNLHVKDHDGKPVMASFRISDGIERVAGKLESIYPLPSRRVAAFDAYPDFFFQPQIYRADGEYVMLAAGKYKITYTRGPEYIPQTKEITIPEGKSSVDVSFQLKRWITMTKLGWYSADHHVHASGCSHYDSPEEGVKPGDMWRQARGEDLNIAALLAWGPSWYNQKKYFTGRDDSLSGGGKILHNDVEVSQFPSSHAGHVVLLRIKEDDYPGTTDIEQWPSWTLPVLNWAKEQNGVVGYAHSGWGLEPVEPTEELPNYVLPKMDGIGANEYVMTVTQNAVDFYSAGDTPAPWELNMYYHTLNCGFKTRLSGETDFPCITDARVGQARSYYKPEGAVTYDGYVAALKSGRSYVSDGKSHIMDFAASGVEAGVKNSMVEIGKGQDIKISANVIAYLPENQDSLGALIAKRPLTEKPYWDIERCRQGKSRKVPVELIVNGFPVDTVFIEADGTNKNVSFSYSASASCWAALRIYTSSHSNPIFIEVGGQRIKEKRSAAWCLAALERCWEMKQANIRPTERAAAGDAYERARIFYKDLIKN